MTKAAILSARRLPACGSCVSVCPAEALVMAGKEVRVGEVMSRIMADKTVLRPVWWWTPACQAGNRCCKRVSARSSPNDAPSRGSAPWSTPPPVSHTAGSRQYGHMYESITWISNARTKAAYRRHTGGSLITVLDNLHRLSDDGADITVRIPIIPHVNDTPEACAHMARHLDGITVKAVHLLPFHKLGLSKYQALGLVYPYAEVPSYSVGGSAPLLRAFSSYPVSIAG